MRPTNKEAGYEGTFFITIYTNMIFEIVTTGKGRHIEWSLLTMSMKDKRRINQWRHNLIYYLLDKQCRQDHENNSIQHENYK